MAIIYRKTAKGVDEIQTRANRLSPRLRGALILLDGQRSDQELLRMVPQAAESLALLLEQGFIELLAELATPPSAARATAAAPSPSTAKDTGYDQTFDKGAAGIKVYDSGYSAPDSLLSSSLLPADTLSSAMSSEYQDSSRPSTRQRNFTLIKREAVRQLNEQVGPAAENLAMNMERCKDLAALRPLLVKARQLIGSLRGKKAADDYITLLSSL